MINLLNLFQLYDKLRKTKPESFKKVIVLPGDMCHPDLDISSSDRELIYNTVDIIMHLAATVRFDETLRHSMILNTRGTKLMLDIAKNCKNLKVS